MGGYFQNSTSDEAVKDFTDILSIISQFIPNKIITINERDSPWLTKSIKNKIKSKHRAYHKFLSHGNRPEEKDHINRLRNETNRLTVNAKDDYFYNLGQTLSDPSLGPKSYWTVLNKILNKKKYTNIPPILINDIFLSNFQTKADLFNDFFVEQCSIYDNESTLPASYIRSDQTLDFIDIDDHKILKAIRNLNTNKAHGCDDISIRMLKICDDSIVLPLRHIFTKCLEFQAFSTLWKRANILPIHKKQSRQLIKNYRPISL